MLPWLTALVLLAAPAEKATAEVTLLAPKSVNLACAPGDPSRGCHVEIPLEIVNTTAASVELVELMASGASLGARSINHTLAPGAHWKGGVEAYQPGEVEVSFQVHDGDTHRMNSPRAMVKVLHPERDRAVEACQACKGDWGRHGLLGSEGCICRTKDAGKVCEDGDDCEGICLFKETVVLRPQRDRCAALKPGQSLGTCDIQLQLSKDVGRCSEFVFQFGCYRYIAHGARKQNPHEGLVSLIQQACAD